MRARLAEGAWRVRGTAVGVAAEPSVVADSRPTRVVVAKAHGSDAWADSRRVWTSTLLELRLSVFSSSVLAPPRPRPVRAVVLKQSSTRRATAQRRAPACAAASESPSRGVGCARLAGGGGGAASPRPHSRRPSSPHNGSPGRPRALPAAAQREQLWRRGHPAGAARANARRQLAAAPGALRVRPSACPSSARSQRHRHNSAFVARSALGLVSFVAVPARGGLRKLRVLSFKSAAAGASGRCCRCCRAARPLATPRPSPPAPARRPPPCPAPRSALRVDEHRARVGPRVLPAHVRAARPARPRCPTGAASASASCRRPAFPFLSPTLSHTHTH